MTGGHSTQGVILPSDTVICLFSSKNFSLKLFSCQLNFVLFELNEKKLQSHSPRRYAEKARSLVWLEQSYGRKRDTLLCERLPYIVTFPDPAFKLDKGLAHFARNLGLPDLAGKE